MANTPDSGNATKAELLSRRRLRTSLPAEGLVFLVILGFVAVCAILRNVNMLVLVSGMMFAPMLLCWRLSRHAIRNVVVKRVLPNRAHAQTMTTVQWQASNRGQLPLFGLAVADRLQHAESGRGLVAERRRERVSGIANWRRIGVGESALTSYRVFFTERGRYEFGPARVSSMYLLPLVRCWFEMPRIESIFVAPPIGRLTVSWSELTARLAAGIQSRSRIRGPDDEEFFGVRQWRAGDNMRKIHWRSTARYRQPMVKQFDGNASSDLAILLDLHLDPEMPYDEFDVYQKRCERILSFAATLVAHWAESRQGSFSLALAAERPVVLSSTRTANFVNQAMQQMAMTAPAICSRVNDTLPLLTESVPPGTTLLVASPYHRLAHAEQRPNGVHSILETEIELEALFQMTQHLSAELDDEWELEESALERTG